MGNKQRKKRQQRAERVTLLANKKKQLEPLVMERIVKFKKKIRSEKIKAGRAQRNIAKHAAARLLKQGEPTLD
jgi:hypothetical protein